LAVATFALHENLKHMHLLENINYSGPLIGLMAFFAIGLFHPIVVKIEYHFGRRVWLALLFIGLTLLGVSVFLSNILATIVGVFGAGLIWSSFEVRWQHERVLKGQAKRNPNRKYGDE